MPDLPDPDLQVSRRLDELDESFAERVVDLRRTVQVLADTVRQLRIDHIRLSNACASIAPDRSKFFADLMADDDTSEQPLP
jgi:hypothetical protein